MTNKIFNKLYFPSLRVKIFQLIFPIKNFRLLISQNINLINLDKKKNYNLILFKVFLQQLILGIPYLIYDFLYYIYLLNQNKQLRKSVLKKEEVKKIGIYIGSFDKYTGGSEKVAAYFALFFEEKFPNAEIIIILNDLFGIQNNSEIKIDLLIQKYGVKLRRTNFRTYNHKFFSLFKINYIKNLIKTTSEFDIIVNCLMNLYPSSAKLNYHYIHFPMDKSTSISNLVFRNYLDSYKMFIANSEYTEYWTKHIFNVNNTKVLYPCIDDPILNELPKKKNIILTVSRLSAEKKIEVLIEVFQANKDIFKDYEFHIVGIANPNNQNYIEQLISSVKSPKIKFFINVSLKELNEHYIDAKIYWNAMGYGLNKNKDPFLFEHFGLTIVEAISYGVVPIVIDNGGPAEIIKKGNCGLTWSSKDDLLNQTIKLIRNQELYDNYQKYAIANSKQFSKEVFFNLFEEILNKDLV